VFDNKRLDSQKVQMFSNFVPMCLKNYYYNSGFFHAYDIGSTIEDLDFWVHLGDYFYEYGRGSAVRSSTLEPPHEIVTLEDYRLRYATYHMDEALQNLRATAPMIATWDDHEVANNDYNLGAQNHNPDTEGDWFTRVRNAAQAYIEWIPIRPGNGPMGPVEKTSLTQTFEFGKLATFVSFDSRVSARSGNPTLDAEGTLESLTPAYTNFDISKYGEDPLKTEFDSIAWDQYQRLYNESYTLVSDDNLDYLANAFQKSKDAGKPWQLYGVGVMMGTYDHIHTRLYFASSTKLACCLFAHSL